MTDLKIPLESPKSLENLQTPEGPWNKTVAFLKRDVKSFFPGGDLDEVSKKQSETGREPGAPTVAAPVESLVDFKKLPDLAIRREVLDWRDNFHANVTLTVVRLQEIFIQQIFADLENTNLFRKLVARPSNEILQESFVRMVRLPLIAAIREEETKLNVTAAKLGSFGKADLSFDLSKLDSECASLHDVRFKPSNKELILSRVQTLLLGPAGLAEQLRDQGVHFSRKLLEAKES